MRQLKRSIDFTVLVMPVFSINIVNVDYEIK